MQLHLHPIRPEALTVSGATLTRWSLEHRPAARMHSHFCRLVAAILSVHSGCAQGATTAGVTLVRPRWRARCAIAAAEPQAVLRYGMKPGDACR